MNIAETYLGTVTLTDTATGGRRPVIRFPDVEPAHLAWNSDEIGDDSIPLYVAEHYMFSAIYSTDDTVTPDSLLQFPFTRISSIDTPDKVKEWRDSYYLKSALCPFGYTLGGGGDIGLGAPVAPWGMSVYGVPKLHPQDQ